MYNNMISCVCVFVPNLYYIIHVYCVISHTHCATTIGQAKKKIKHHLNTFINASTYNIECSKMHS